MEIEKKFLIKHKPCIKKYNQKIEIKQGYLSGTAECRVRKIDNKHYLTIKSKGNLIREEWETIIPEWVFNELWSDTENRRISKNRYIIQENQRTLEIDAYKDKFVGLYILECEFSTKKEALEFRTPLWLREVIDVTEDPRYKNRNLAEQGLPDLT